MHVSVQPRTDTFRSVTAFEHEDPNFLTLTVSETSRLDDLDITTNKYIWQHIVDCLASHGITATPKEN